MFIVLLSFGESLATKCMSLSNESCVVSLTLIDLNLVELKYHPSMISLNKYSRSGNATNDLSPKICVPSKTKDVNVKIFNMRTNKNEAKTMVKHISCDCKCRFNSPTCNSNQKWNMINANVSVKIIVCAKNTNTCICENSKHLKHIVGDLEMLCDEVTYVTDIVSTNASINFDDKKVRYKMDCYILHTVLLVITLLLIIAIIYHYAKHRSKLKNRIVVLKM